MKKPEPYTDADGEARELDADFFAKAKRGRPVLDETDKRQRVNFTLDRDVVTALRSKGGNASERVNRLLREDLGL